MIKITSKSTETFEWSVNGCRQFVPFNPNFPQGAGEYVYPSLVGSAEDYAKTESDCCFDTTCLAVKLYSPDPNPTVIETTQTYNVIDIPFNLDKTTVTPLDPFDIEDVDVAARDGMNEIPFRGSQDGWNEGYFWSGITADDGAGISAIQTQMQRYSSPFSESGFNNSAEITLSETEYSIRIDRPPVTCYVKLWFAEVFLPVRALQGTQFIENWPIDPINDRPIPQIKSRFEVEHNFGSGGEMDKTCYKSEGIDFDAGNGGFAGFNSVLLTPQPRTMNAPSEPGVNALVLLKYSWLPGYTPNDLVATDGVWTQGCKPNGFPSAEPSCQ